MPQLILSNIKERDEGLGETAETVVTLSLFSRNPELPPTSVKFNASRKEKCSGTQKDAFFLKNTEKTRGGGRQRNGERETCHRHLISLSHETGAQPLLSITSRMNHRPLAVHHASQTAGYSDSPRARSRDNLLMYDDFGEETCCSGRCLG